MGARSGRGKSSSTRTRARAPRDDVSTHDAEPRTRSKIALPDLSFDVRIRTDKLRAWLHRNPGETPPGLTSEDVAAILGD